MEESEDNMKDEPEREALDFLGLIVSKGRLVEALGGSACPWPLPMASCFSDFACTVLGEYMADAVSVLVEVGGGESLYLQIDLDCFDGG